MEKGVHSIILNSIRLALVLILTYSLFISAPLLQFVSLLALLITYLPTILEKYFKIKVPASFDIIILLFIYGLLFISEVRNLIHLWWWDLFLNVIASFALGFVGLSIIYVLYAEKRLDIHPLFIPIFTFAIAFSIGTLWELFEYSLDTIFRSNLQASLQDTMNDLITELIGILIISLSGFYYIQKGKEVLISDFVSKIVKKNLYIISPEKITPEKELEELIKKGESENLEFKSTFRTNLHTKEYDKRLEHGILKTITAFLNTKGGNLLIGVNDGGYILGLDHDNFLNEDKMLLHLTNLIRTKIGNEFLPFIKTEVIGIKEKKVLKITCEKSQKQVFLKNDGEEEFYVRNGPASIKLNGNSLIDYIKHRFS